MSRQCQRRRKATEAQRSSRPNPKPSGPPPIRHKARQKAINNARHDRGGRGGGRGGQQSRYQRSGNANGNGHAEEQDFGSFTSSGNNFGAFDRSGSRHNPIALDGNDSLDDGEGMSDESMDISDSEDMVINVQMHSGQPQATVMFTLVQAVAVYRRLRDAGFPLLRSTVSRYGIQEEATPHLESRPQTHALAPLQYSCAPSRSDAVVGSMPAPVHQPVSTSSSRVSSLPSRQLRAEAVTKSSTQASSQASNTREDYHPARDYLFNWGYHQGKHFRDVPESYLRTIGKITSIMNCHHGLKEAFDYHMPGLRGELEVEKAAQKVSQQKKAAGRASWRG